jgi:hypothetical protein
VVVDDREGRTLSQPWAQLVLEGMAPISVELSDQGRDPADRFAQDRLMVARLHAPVDEPTRGELTVSDLAPGAAGRLLERRTITLDPDRPTRVEVKPRQALGRAASPTPVEEGPAKAWVASARRRADGGRLPLIPGPLGLGLVLLGLGLTWHRLHRGE